MKNLIDTETAKIANAKNTIADNMAIYYAALAIGGYDPEYRFFDPSQKIDADKCHEAIKDAGFTDLIGDIATAKKQVQDRLADANVFAKVCNVRECSQKNCTYIACQAIIKAYRQLDVIAKAEYCLDILIHN